MSLSPLFICYSEKSIAVQGAISPLSKNFFISRLSMRLNDDDWMC